MNRNVSRNKTHTRKTVHINSTGTGTSVLETLQASRCASSSAIQSHPLMSSNKAVTVGRLTEFCELLQQVD